MPIIKSNYNPPLFFKSGHASTVYSGLFRRVDGIQQERERMTLSDGDFLDLDWSYAQGGSESLIILLHGLEGNAQRPYMLGSAKLFNSQAYDAVCVNFRNCSETPNTKYRSYHSGATEDLHDVIEHVIHNRKYSRIYIVGLSLGGNMTLKYLGERSAPDEIKGAVAISVPCSLYHSMLQLKKFENILYNKRFKKYLLQKLRQKQEQFPDLISDKDIASIKTLKDFDDVYTSRAHGFKDALDYYERSSSLGFIPEIKTPALIINAQDDSFLSPECYPIKAAKENKHLFLEMPKYGGHVGFYDKDGVFYNEKRSLEFVKNIF